MTGIPLPKLGITVTEMAIQTELKEVTTTREEVVARICDLCGHVSSELLGHSDDWKGFRSFEVDETVVERKYGTSYPEGGCVTIERFDICPACWVSELVPWLKSRGA